MIKFLIVMSLLLNISGAYAIPFGQLKETVPVLDSGRNAFIHNNKGCNYFEEGEYIAAIKEFNIAIGLNPNTQATAIYYNNLGRTYLKILAYSLAQKCFENSITQDCMNFEYYQNLANTLVSLGQTNSKLSYYLSKKNNPYSKIMAALLYEKKGQKKLAIATFDDFLKSENNLVISTAIKEHIKRIQKL